MKRKETKPEKLRRLEDEKMKAGKLKMRSELWRQRRGKDGRLVRVWKEVEKSRENSCLVEHEDPWMEEFIFTVEERTALQELENWYQTVRSLNNFSISSGVSSQDVPETTTRQSSREEDGTPKNTTSEHEKDAETILDVRKIGPSAAPPTPPPVF